jgi:hypothetical protein
VCSSDLSRLYCLPLPYIFAFVAVSKKANMYGNGRQLSRERFELMKGLNVYFYDLDSATKEFKNFGLIDIQEIDEPIKHMDNQPPINYLAAELTRY